MKNLITLLLILSLFSCKTRQVINNTSTDTVYIDRSVVVSEKIRVDTVFVELPAIKEQVIRKDSSLLLNKYSSSFAYIRNDGLLYHDLHFIPQKIETPVKVIDTVVKIDSVFIEKKADTIEVPVKIPIPKWKQILMWIGVGAVVFAVYKITRIFV